MENILKIRYNQKINEDIKPGEEIKITFGGDGKSTFIEVSSDSIENVIAVKGVIDSILTSKEDSTFRNSPYRGEYS